MDVVSREARSGLLSELLYADDLYLWHQHWSSLVYVDKGLKVNAGMSNK